MPTSQSDTHDTNVQSEYATFTTMYLLIEPKCLLVSVLRLAEICPLRSVQTLV